MLQFRIFSYADAHRYRLGSVNYTSLPVNGPRVPAHDYQRDGAMRFDENGGGSVNYQPTSYGGLVEDPEYKEPPLHVSGYADRYDHRVRNDDYGPPAPRPLLGRGCTRSSWGDIGPPTKKNF